MDISIFAPIIIIFLVFALAFRSTKRSTQDFCTNCHSIIYAKKETKGSFLIEVALWIFFIVPGVIYSIWRMTTKEWCCPECGSSNLAPLHSPVAQKYISETNHLSEKINFNKNVM